MFIPFILFIHFYNYQMSPRVAWLSDFQKRPERKKAIGMVS